MNTMNNKKFGLASFMVIYPFVFFGSILVFGGEITWEDFFGYVLPNSFLVTILIWLVFLVGF